MSDRLSWGVKPGCRALRHWDWCRGSQGQLKVRQSLNQPCCKWSITCCVTCTMYTEIFDGGKKKIIACLIKPWLPRKHIQGASQSWDEMLSAVINIRSSAAPLDAMLEKNRGLKMGINKMGPSRTHLNRKIWRKKEYCEGYCTWTWHSFFGLITKKKKM